MFNIETQKIMIWDKFNNKMVVKTEVWVQVVGSQGTVFFEEGPIFCESGQEIFQAITLLKQTLIKKHCLKEQPAQDTLI